MEDTISVPNEPQIERVAYGLQENHALNTLRM